MSEDVDIWQSCSESPELQSTGSIMCPMVHDRVMSPFLSDKLNNFMVSFVLGCPHALSTNHSFVNSLLGPTWLVSFQS